MSKTAKMVQYPNRQGICKAEEIGATRLLGTDKLTSSLEYETDIKINHYHIKNL